MKKLTAIVRFQRNGNITNITDEMPTKKEFAQELRANGIRVKKILTDAQIKEIKKNAHKYLRDEIEEYVIQCL